MAEQQPSLKDLAYRTVAGILGMPVDLAAMVVRPFGYKVPEQEVVGGSEWIGKQMERAGLASSARSPLKEFLAGFVSPAGMAKGAASTAMFIGPLARTWRAADADKFQAMEAAGELLPYSMRGWQQTGTMRGPEQILRQEISDDTAKIIADPRMNVVKRRLQDVLDHPELYAAYPDLRKMDVSYRAEINPASYGSYIPESDRIKVYGNVPESEARGVLLHEIQHAVQRREGFARGGNPQEFMRPGGMKDWFDEADSIHRRADHFYGAANIKQAMTQRGLSANEAAEYVFGRPLSGLDQKMVDLLRSPHNPDKLTEMGNAFRQAAAEREMIGKIGPFESYRRLAGEAEARLTQNRRGFTQAERAMRPPFVDLDIDPVTQIIRSQE